MDPPPIPPPKQFLKPQEPSRLRGQTTRPNPNSTSNVSSVSSSVPASLISTTDGVLAEQFLPTSTPGNSSHAAGLSRDKNAGIIHYTKPAIASSQIDPSQPTQLLCELEGLDLSEDNKAFACLRGHRETTDVDLTRDKSLCIFGTSSKCDVQINHSHWQGHVDSRVMDEPWFKIHAEPSKSVPGEMKVYIEDVSTTGVYVGGKKLDKSERKLLKWGATIKGGPDNSEHQLFYYSLMSIQQDGTLAIIQAGEKVYHVAKKSIGSGNYSRVYMAKEQESQSVYACKVFDRHAREYSEQEIDGIEFEISLLRGLKHDNIVRFQDVAQNGPKTFLFLEYIDGLTLHHYFIAKDSYFAEYEIRPIFKQVCKAVEYLHSQDIVHRDIKCENIMVASIDEKDIKIKLIDFGLARRNTSERVFTTFCGTGPYMAPETAVGEETNGYGKSVDVWALGVVLFKMLTGEYPFPRKQYGNEDNVVVRQVEEELSNVEPNAAEIETVRQEPQISYSLGHKPFYKDNWRPRLNKQGPRSSEEALLDIDASRRCLIQHVLRFDWMRMSSKELRKFDFAAPSLMTVIQGTTEASAEASAETSEQPEDRVPSPQRKIWGVLTIIPGSIPDAPRRIELCKDITNLGRDFRRMDVVLGQHRRMSAHQCTIHRNRDGVVLVSDASFNGTYINSMKIEAQKACQLFTGDEIGIVVPADDETTLMNSPGDELKRYLKYKAEIIGVPAATQDELVRRRYFKWETEIPTRPRRRPPSPEPENTWAFLHRLNPEGENGDMYELFKEKTRVGRDCCTYTEIPLYIVFKRSWSMDRKAYLINRSPNGTLVNGESCSGRFQLRNKDEIQLANPDKIPDPEQKEKLARYKIEFAPMEESAPSSKRPRG
ncbi:Checkpoint kinase 2 [Modicella reniformis]|uniref:non-specific serine/threonine protein kinase n=1 Tax=Modicella reniformis TaxID=1440133 RepID=A0A9P6J2H3_9FUNG|nr:Checkpoint kinase 2 [Modicella reniformis]